MKLKDQMQFENDFKLLCMIYELLLINYSDYVFYSLIK